MTDYSVIITKDDDGNEHVHHVMLITKEDHHNQAMAARHSGSTASPADRLRDVALRESAYFQEINVKRTADDPAEDTTNNNNNNNKSVMLRSPRPPPPKEHFTLQISDLNDVKTTVESYTSRVRARGKYTLGSNALLSNMSSENRYELRVPGAKHLLGDVDEHGDRPRALSNAYKKTAMIFKEAQEAKQTRQGKSESIQNKLKFRSALKSLMKSKRASPLATATLPESGGLSSSTSSKIASRPTERNQRKRTHPSLRSPRRIVLRKKQKDLIEHIVQSDLLRRKVQSGQTMKSVEIQARVQARESSHGVASFATKSEIANDLHLQKQVWSLKKSSRLSSSKRTSFDTTSHSSRGRRAFHGSRGSHDLQFNNKGRKKSSAGGNFLHLDSRHHSALAGGNLPANKQHWNTTSAGPHARSAALQTERLQRVEDTNGKQVDVHGIAKGRRALAEEKKQEMYWKELVGTIRSKRAHVAHSTETREHVVQAVLRSDKTLQTWQDNFLELHKTHDSRLRNALAARDLHREEMNTGEHIGYILTRVEMSAKKTKPNGSEALQHNISRGAIDKMQSAKSISRRTEKDDVWRPRHDKVPDVTKKGSLTSFWTETRIERRTNDEIQSLGTAMVTFWSQFCLLRATLPGLPAAGELVLVRTLKALLEDGDNITEQVVHDMMVMLEASGDPKHPRLMALLKAMRKQVEVDG